MSLADDINIRQIGKAGRITLTRPEALNAMTYDMCLAIEQALIGWRADPSIKLVVIDAEGDRAFCAGGDIQQLYDTGMAGDYEYGRKFWADEYRLNAMIANYPKPYVPIMDGIVMGGGVGISAHGSHRIVTERTLFAMPECGIGLVPDVGGNKFLAAAPGHIGEYLGATGARLRAADCLYTGIADANVPAAQMDELVEALEDTGGLSVIDTFVAEPEAGELGVHQKNIDQHFSHRTAVEIIQSLEAVDGEWEAGAAKLMRRNCPLAVACAIEIVRRCRNLGSIEEILGLEYRFSWRSMSDGDFLEGIRAAVIDKDRSPKWQHDLDNPPSLAATKMLMPLGKDKLTFD